MVRHYIFNQWDETKGPQYTRIGIFVPENSTWSTRSSRFCLGLWYKGEEWPFWLQCKKQVGNANNIHRQQLSKWSYLLSWNNLITLNSCQGKIEILEKLGNFLLGKKWLKLVSKSRKSRKLHCAMYLWFRLTVRDTTTLKRMKQSAHCKLPSTIDFLIQMHLQWRTFRGRSVAFKSFGSYLETDAYVFKRYKANVYMQLGWLWNI